MPLPTRWGRNLLLRRERKQAKAEARPARPLLDIDYLTLVEDLNRLGGSALPTTAANEGQKSITSNRSANVWAPGANSRYLDPIAVALGIWIAAWLSALTLTIGVVA